MPLSGLKLSLNRLSHITHMGIDNSLLRASYTGRDDAIANLEAIELRVTETGRVVTVLVFPDRKIQSPSPRRVGFPIKNDMGLIMTTRANAVKSNFVSTYTDERGYDRELGTVSTSKLTACIGKYSADLNTVQRSAALLRRLPMEPHTSMKCDLHPLTCIELSEALHDVPRDLIDPWLLGTPIVMGNVAFFSPKYVDLGATKVGKKKHSYVGGFMWRDYMIMFDFHKFKIGKAIFWSDKKMDQSTLNQLTSHINMAKPIFSRIRKTLEVGRKQNMFIGRHELDIAPSKYTHGK